MTATVEVTNTGDRASGHVALLFARDLVASVVPRERQLKGFERLHMEPGETQTVFFKLAPEDFSFIDRDMERVTEPGAFCLMAGDRETTFTYSGE